MTPEEIRARDISYARELARFDKETDFQWGAETRQAISAMASCTASVTSAAESNATAILGEGNDGRPL